MQQFQALLSEHGISLPSDVQVQRQPNGQDVTVSAVLNRREYMAMHFMAAIISSTVLDDLPEETQAAKDAVLYADALIAELQKPLNRGI